MFKRKYFRYSILVFFLLLWLLQRYSREKQEQSGLDHIEIDQDRDISSTEIPPASEEIIPKTPTLEADDLTQISGIGPKISSVLTAAGINSYSQLAGSNVDQINLILRDAGLRLGNPSEWIQQAQEITYGDPDTGN
jgi:predicted flap endonuclease-1-like 5' DNA nuclease